MHARLLDRAWLSLRIGLSLCRRTALAAGPLVRCGLLARHNVNQEVEHVGLGQCICDVGALQRAPLVFLGVYPGAHRQLRDEHVASLCEEDGSLGRNHFDFRVRLHNLLYPRQRQLVELVVMVVRLELGDLLLPVGVEDVAILASEALVDLEARQHDRVADETRKHTFAH